MCDCAARPCKGDQRALPIDGKYLGCCGYFSQMMQLECACEGGGGGGVFQPPGVHAALRSHTCEHSPTKCDVLVYGSPGPRLQKQ